MLDDADAGGAPVRFWKDDYLTDATWPRYDADGNRHVWVRSEASCAATRRAIVAWVKIEDRIVSFPRYAVLSGYLHGKNSGGTAAARSSTRRARSASPCAATAPPQSTCVDLNPTKGRSSSRPATSSSRYPNSVRDRPDELAGARGHGEGERHLVRTCPANPNGDVVYVKNAGTCRYTNSAPAAPGAVEVLQHLRRTRACTSSSAARVDFGGNIEFWGVVYNANLDNSSRAALIETSGTAAIHGGVLVDGNGGVYAGSSGDNIVYHAFAFDDIKAVGTAGVVQNTWREIVPAGQ